MRPDGPFFEDGATGQAKWLWAKVEYDGTDFYGFQVQANERTVQGEVERALGAVTGQNTRVVGAGRTDRGVHASGQVIAFETQWRHSLSELCKALNAVLDKDVAILQVGRAAAGFHPRFSAQSRTYRYRILNRQRRSPLDRRSAWHIRSDLDVGPMCRASEALVGTLDFSTFGRPPQGDNTVREIMKAEWQASEPYLQFEIRANAFLYRMVRSIVGVLVLVGLGQVSPAQFKEILHARDRAQVRLVAPPQGLCLMRVDYATGEGVQE